MLLLGDVVRILVGLLLQIQCSRSVIEYELNSSYFFVTVILITITEYSEKKVRSRALSKGLLHFEIVSHRDIQACPIEQIAG